MSTKTHPAIGRIVATREQVYWDWQSHPHLALRGFGKGKTNLARGIARQWKGPVLVLGQSYEWDVDVHHVQPDIDGAVTALEGLVNEATEPSLTVVDGLDGQVVDGADSEDIEHIYALLRQLSAAKNVHLLVITRAEQVEWAESVQVLADDTLMPFSGRLPLSQDPHDVLEVHVPFIAPPGWEVRRS